MLTYANTSADIALRALVKNVFSRAALWVQAQGVGHCPIVKSYHVGNRCEER